MKVSTKVTKIIARKEKIRLDTYLASYFSIYSRTYFQKLIQNKGIKIGKNFPKVNYLIKRGEIIEIRFLPTEEESIKPQNIPLDILYEDKDILAVNKPAGMVVYPACGHRDGTLVNALLYYARIALKKDKESSSSWSEFYSFGDDRPGIVHRLDKDTSGVILIAKTKASQFFLAKQFKKRRIEKTYWALVVGKVKDKDGEIIAPLGRAPYERKKIVVGSPLNKEAITCFKVKEEFSSFTPLECILRQGEGEKDKAASLKKMSHALAGDFPKGFTLLEIKPKTGRTHQIRVHLSYIGHPILGDREYCTKWNIGDYKIKRQLLHAYRLEFLHPAQKKKMKLEAPIPEDFEEVLKILRTT